MDLTTAGFGVVPGRVSSLIHLGRIEHRPEHANSRDTDPSLLVSWMGTKPRLSEGALSFHPAKGKKAWLLCAPLSHMLAHYSYNTYSHRHDLLFFRRADPLHLSLNLKIWLSILASPRDENASQTLAV